MKDVAADIPIYCFVDGLDWFSTENSNINKVEVRVHGPDVKQTSANVYRVRVGLNLIISNFVSATSNGYDIYTWCGKFEEAMTNLIPIYKIGDGGDLVGCLTYKRTKDTELRVFHFPRVTKDDMVRQSELDCNYEMEI
jgi:hypothetical protein